MVQSAKPIRQRSPFSGRYEEQMIASNPGSQSPDLDAARDAQETAEDSAMLKRFKILNLVGTGNYARVYRVSSHSGRELAIKSINLSKTSENYKLKFLPREISILKKITHSNICKVHEISQISDRIFIVMQYCSKGTIADLLHKIGPLSEPISRGLFVPVIDAINYLHSIDLAHRDIKVENILLDCDYNPKITDFSYSVNISERSKCKKSSSLPQNSQKSPNTNITRTPQSPQECLRLNDTFCGTLPYLSPEMIRQNPYDPKKTDIWSLGICLYVMINDRLPFPFDDIKLMVKKQMSRDFRFKTNLDISEQCKEIIHLMLEPEFTKRPSTHELSKHQWIHGPREKPQSAN